MARVQHCDVGVEETLGPGSHRSESSLLRNSEVQFICWASLRRVRESQGLRNIKKKSKKEFRIIS